MADVQTTRRRSTLTARGLNRAMIRMFLTAILTWCTGAMAATGADLYRTKVTVTGQGEANRMVGFATGLEDVLIKASGAQKLSGDRRLAAYKSKAKNLVTAFSYRDQFFGKPIRDEQGTRDRPFDLTVDFDEGKIDDILKALGFKPWLSHRPSLAVFVEMEQGAKTYIVTTDGTQSDLQRDALLAAADKRGMDIVLPGTAALAKANITGAELRTPSFPALAPVAAELGGEVFWSDDWPGMTVISAGPRSGRWTGAARRTVGKSAASRSMKPFDAASAARPRSCQAMAIRSPDRRRRQATSCIDAPSMLSYPARKPPSTATTVPVAYCDAGMQRKATAPATSCGCPHRLKAVRSAMRW
jgi:hypothetical protein